MSLLATACICGAQWVMAYPQKIYPWMRWGADLLCRSMVPRGGGAETPNHAPPLRRSAHDR